MLLKTDIRSVTIAGMIYFALFLSFGCWLYPLNGDDFYLLTVAGERGVWQEIWRCYNEWTIRAGGICGLILYGNTGKWLFNLLLPLIAVAAAWLGSFFILKRRPDLRNPADCWSLLLIFSGMLISARPRDTFFWMCGASDYLNGVVIWFAFFCLLIRCKNTQKKHPAGVLLFPAGIIAAYSLEYLMAAGVLLIGGTLLLRFRQKRSISRNCRAGIAGYVCGCFLFVTTPGMYARAASGAALPGGEIMNRIALLPEVALFWGFAALPGLAAGLLFAVFSLWCGRAFFRRGCMESGWFFLLSFAAVPFYALLGVTPAMRAYMPGSFFALLGAAKLAWMLLDEKRFHRPVCSVLGVISAIALLWSLSSVPDFIKIAQDQKKRDLLIAEAQKQGIKELAVPPHRVLRHHFFQYVWMEDITENKEFFTNQYAAGYYKFDSIRTLPGNSAKLFWRVRQ